MDKEVDKKVSPIQTDAHVKKNLVTIVAIVVGGGIVLMLGVGLLTFGFVREHPGVLARDTIRRDIAIDRNGGPGMRGFGFRGGMMDDNQNRLTGVVTKVDGKNFTIAGNGTTNSITVNDSTQYTNGSTVAINDTVFVSGTVNNGTFTATQVTINPGH